MHVWGGDATAIHNGIRDVFVDYCARAGLDPKDEAPGLLRNADGRRSRERPADVLVLPHLNLQRELPDGSRAVRAEKVCLDFAVVNALGANHWSETAQDARLPSENYADRKCNRAETQARCAQLGLVFTPIIFTQQGGRTKVAHSVIKAISACIADRENSDVATVTRAFNERIAVLLARSTASMIARRYPTSVVYTQWPRIQRALDASLLT